jgi:hypothetical protein
VYDVFRVYADSLYRTGLPFVVLPTSMRYSVDDSIESVMSSSHWGDQYLYREGPQYPRRSRLPYRKDHINSVRDFRPTYRSGKARILYLGETYNLALQLLLQPPESHSDESYHLLAAESKRRAEFLSNRIPVLCAPNAYYFFFQPQPMIDLVALSKDLMYAEVSFSWGHLTGSSNAYFKTSNGWAYLDGLGLMWIQ